MRRLALPFLLLVGAAALPTAQVVPRADPAPPLSLSLDAAVRRALDQSEEVGLAQAQVDLADAQIRQARASLYPQLNGTLGYTRTLASSFNTGGGFTLPDSLQFNPDPNAPIEERLRYLEENVQNAALGALGGLFSDLPFGQENVYALGLSGSQALFSPSTGPALAIARRVREAAELTLVEQTADLRLQVEQAYIQALVAQELVGISEAALAQAQAFLDQTRLRLEAGRASELEVLRADVELENLRPQLVQALDAADLATLNLKRLTNIPYDQPVALTTPLTLPPPEALAVPVLDPAAAVAGRAAIRAAEAQVAIGEQQVRLQRRSYLPSISLQSGYQRQFVPEGMFDFSGGDWRTDWTVGVNVQVPIFDGFRRRAQLQQARVQLTHVELQRDQLVENVGLQVEQAQREKGRAAALIAARQRTVEQAARVFRLTELQYREGLATQLEVSTSRLALLTARSNLVQALAAFYTAETDLARATVVPDRTGPGFTLPQGTPLPQPDALAPPAGLPTPLDPTPSPTGEAPTGEAPTGEAPTGEAPAPTGGQ
jgi:outer membrane protein TolC